MVKSIVFLYKVWMSVDLKHCITCMIVRTHNGFEYTHFEWGKSNNLVEYNLTCHISHRDTRVFHLRLAILLFPEAPPVKILHWLSVLRLNLT